MKDDNYSDDLNQIRASQVAVLDTIDAIREREGSLPHEVDKIQKDALSIVYEIDEIIKRRDHRVKPETKTEAASDANRSGKIF